MRFIQNKRPFDAKPFSRIEKIGVIADWIGFALEGRIHGFNAAPYAQSTIVVEQTKSKFERAVVYCRLADERLIQLLWETEDTIRSVPEDFKRQCLAHDRYHYHQVYMTAKQLFPHMWQNIVAGAQYSLLTYESPAEFNAAMCDYAVGITRGVLSDELIAGDVERYFSEMSEIAPDLCWDLRDICTPKEVLALPRLSDNEILFNRFHVL